MPEVEVVPERSTTLRQNLMKFFFFCRFGGYVAYTKEIVSNNSTVFYRIFHK